MSRKPNRVPRAEQRHQAAVTRRLKVDPARIAARGVVRWSE